MGGGRRGCATIVSVATVEQIAPATTVGAVELTVSDLDRSLDYYRTSIGLDVLERGEGRASLGAGGPSCSCSSRSRVPCPPTATPGSSISRCSSRRASASRGGSPTPRATGVAAHRPLRPRRERGAVPPRPRSPRDRDLRRPSAGVEWEGKAGELLTTRPLDTDSLLGELDDPASEPFDGLPSGTVMGHIHLRVAVDPGDGRVLPRRARLRPDRGAARPGRVPLRGRLSPSRGREHVGERGGAPAPAGTAALRHATIVLPDADARERVVVARRARRSRDSRSRRRSGRVRPGWEQLVLATAP